MRNVVRRGSLVFMMAAVAGAALGASACSPASSGKSDVAAGQGNAGPAGDQVPSFGHTGGACHETPTAVFDNALCVCGDVRHGGSLVTEAKSGERADVGINGAYQAGGETDVAGSLYAGSIGRAGSVRARDHVTSLGDLVGSGTLAAGRDLAVGGNFEGAFDLDVGGALRIGGSDLHVDSGKVAARGPYTAPSGPPCACDDAKIMDVAKLVAQAKGSNDNAARGLSTNAADVVGQGDITLTAGRYYFADVTRVGDARVRIEGAVKLYFDGSITLVGSHQFTLAPGATLDMFVAGTVAHAGEVDFGDATRPSAFRLYMGGADSVLLGSGTAGFHGMVYAPRAKIAFGGDTLVEGSLFAKDIEFGGTLRVRYSAPEGERPKACDAPPQPTPK